MPTVNVVDDGNGDPNETSVPTPTADPVEEPVAAVVAPVEDPEDEEDEDLSEVWNLDSMPQDEPIWDEGPTPAMLKEWKAQFGEEEIYYTYIRSNKRIVWRTLSRFEYRNLIRNVEQMVSTGTVSQGEANLNNEEAVTEMCVLWPKMNRQSIVKDNAGLASLIAQQVMEASSFVAMDIRQL